MGYRQRISFTQKQKAEIWDRWQRGESMSSIGRRFDRNSSSIYPLLARTGGIRPGERKRSRLALTLVEREEISRGLRGQQSLRSIARPLRRAPSLPLLRPDPHAVLAEDVGRDDHALDLAGALEDLVDTGVTEGPFEGEVPREAQAPVDLQRLVDGPGHHFRAI